MSYFSPVVAQRGDVTPWDAMIDEQGARYGVEPALIRAVIAAESAWNPTAVSHNASSYGLMQINIAAHGLTQEFAFNPAAAIGYGTRLLAEQIRRLGGDVQLALAAYNAGTSRSAADLTQRIAANTLGVGTYVRTVLDYLGYYRGVAALRAPAPIAPTPPGDPIADAYAGEGWGELLDGDAWAAGGLPAAQDGEGVLGAGPGLDPAALGLLAALGAGILAVVALSGS